MDREPSVAAYACPDCGAVLRDTRLRVCPYCHSALFEENSTGWKRVWHTSDGGLTWSVRERVCAACGATASNPDQVTCDRCGAAMGPLVLPHDPRPATAIEVRLPPMPVPPDRVTIRVQHLVRYLDNNWWPVPPSVPRDVAALLRLLPDECPQCRGRSFQVGLSAAGAWQVLCRGCGTAPGSRVGTDTPPY